MGVEDEIRGHLVAGILPKDLIEKHHYSKSTVYKVLRDIKRQESSTLKPSWIIHGINLNNSRFLPDEVVSMSYSLRNDGSVDLYVYQVGIRPEWMKSKWYVHGERFLLRPQESRILYGSFKVPADLSLGEYDLLFGVNGQFLPLEHSTFHALGEVQWSYPLVLHVKRHPIGLKIFISHSTKDIHLVRALEQYLDNNGIEVIIAEDRPEPGVLLWDKISRQIHECDVFLSLLTFYGTRSDWVIKETNYALKLGKPSILLKEKSIPIETGHEWVEFSQDEPIEEVCNEILRSIDKIKDQLVRRVTVPIGGLLLGALLVFIAGLGMGRLLK